MISILMGGGRGIFHDCADDIRGGGESEVSKNGEHTVAGMM